MTVRKPNYRGNRGAPPNLIAGESAEFGGFAKARRETAHYSEQCEKLGQKRGDIKLAAIDSRTGWDQVFEPILARRYES